MKSNVMKGFFFLGLFLFSVLQATPTGNPNTPKIIDDGLIFSSASYFSFRLGYEGNFIENGKFEQKNFVSNKIKNFSYCLNSGMVTINLLKRLDLFATFGSGRIESDWTIKDGVDTYSFLDLQTEYDWAWSVGTKIIFFEWGKTSLSIGGRYFYTTPKIDYFSKSNTIYSINDQLFRWKEWQVDLGLSYKIDLLTPYISAKYSQKKASFSINDVIITSNGMSKMKLKNQNDIGLALGFSISTGKIFMMNAEVRLIDEEAFTISGEFKF